MNEANQRQVFQVTVRAEGADPAGGKGLVVLPHRGGTKAGGKGKGVQLPPGGKLKKGLEKGHG